MYSLKRDAPSSEFEETKRMKLMCKPNAYELSNAKVVYNRDIDDETNLIVRSFNDVKK